MFTAHEVEELVQAAFENGARSFLLKTDESDHMVNAITAAAAHKPYFTPRVSEIVFARLEQGAGKGPRPEPGSLLTALERETLRLAAEGRSNKEIATELGVSLRTAESHRAALMKKLGLNSVGELVRFAIRNRIIEP
jgi:DNA-binding NarL/FixJ family response regulator